MMRQLPDIAVNIVRRLAERDGDDLFVHLSVVEHVDDADGIALHERCGQDGFAAQYEHVERIAVVGKRARDKAVACGIYRRGIQHPVQFKNARLLVQFVLALGTLCISM